MYFLRKIISQEYVSQSECIFKNILFFSNMSVKVNVFIIFFFISQECHKPPVTEQDVNDPRFVWYCCKCSKNMKKMVSLGSNGIQQAFSFCIYLHYTGNNKYLIIKTMAVNV